MRNFLKAWNFSEVSDAHSTEKIMMRNSIDHHREKTKRSAQFYEINFSCWANDVIWCCRQTLLHSQTLVWWFIELPIFPSLVFVYILHFPSCIHTINGGETLHRRDERILLKTPRKGNFDCFSFLLVWVFCTAIQHSDVQKMLWLNNLNSVTV